MARQRNRLSGPKTFALNLEVRKFVENKPFPPFKEIEEAEIYFTKVLGFVVTACNIESAIIASGQERDRVLNLRIESKQTTEAKAIFDALKAEIADLREKHEALNRRITVLESGI